MSVFPPRWLRSLALVALVATLAGCASAPAPRCAAGQQLMTSESLYFGTATPDGTVSADDWQRFLAEEVTPRFPDGLTAWPANGQWRGADGTITREASYVLQVLHDGSTAKRAALDEIAWAYKQRFRQESVLRTTTPACTAFL